MDVVSSSYLDEVDSVNQNLVVIVSGSSVFSTCDVRKFFGNCFITAESVLRLNVNAENMKAPFKI